MPKIGMAPFWLSHLVCVALAGAVVTMLSEDKCSGLQVYLEPESPRWHIHWKHV